MADLPRQLAFEALHCVAVRVRWYEMRGRAVPERTMRTLKHLAAGLGVDVRAVR